MADVPKLIPARVPRVIVAEDDAQMRALAVSTLRREGLTVEEAANGNELIVALEASFAGDRAFDLVVSDVRMPGCTGLEVLRRIRADQRVTPFVIMSAFSDSATRKEAATLDATVLDKPFRIDALRALVARILGLAHGNDATAHGRSGFMRRVILGEEETKKGGAR